MGLLDDAIREHLDLKRARGADPTEIERLEREALGPVRREPTIGSAQYEAQEHYPEDQAEFLSGPEAEPFEYHDSTAPHAQHLDLAGDPTETDVLEPQPQAEPHKRRFLRRSRSEPPAEPAPAPELYDDHAQPRPAEPAGDPEQPSPHAAAWAGYREDAESEYEAPGYEEPEAFDEHGLAAEEGLTVEYDALSEHDLTDEHPVPPAADEPVPDQSEDLTAVHKTVPDEQEPVPDESEDLTAVHRTVPDEQEPPASEPPAPASDDPATQPAPLRFDQPPRRPHFSALPDAEEPGSEEPETPDDDRSAYEEPEGGEDVLEETPEFLQDTPEHDRLWFEQRPPKDFDFDG